MEKDKMNELVVKYNEGLADPKEIQWIEELIERGELELTQLRNLHQLNEQVVKMKMETPSMNLDARFYEMLAAEKGKSKSSSSFSWPDWKILLPRLALVSCLLLIGFVAGYWLQRPSSGTEVQQLTQQVEGMKEMMMISLLEKESATERLKAVSLTQDINDPSKQVTIALLKTLNADPNVSVRLAALDALQGYAQLPQVREGLVRSIAMQESPLVQVALAELMVAIQEKSSVSELKKVLAQKATPKEVKEKIRKSIDVLI